MASSHRYLLGKRATGTGTSSSASRSSTPKPSAHAAASITPVASTSEDRRMTEYSSQDDVCPVCKTDRYLNPKLRLMVSWCYHKMCENCMDRIFSLGPEPCPICNTVIRKAQFRPQIFEDLGVQKEVAIRKRMAKIFNKREEDFKELSQYNDYLEDYENLTFNLINSQDLPATEQRIKQYESENRLLIETNLNRGEKEKEMVKRREEEERRVKEEIKRRYEELDEEERRGKEEERKRVLEGLESSSSSTSSIISAARQRTLLRSSALATTTATSSLFSLPTSFSHSHSFSPSPSPEPEDILDELFWFDGGEELYDLRGVEEGYGPSGEGGNRNDEENEQRGKEEGGWLVEEVWEKSIRACVVGVWEVPLGGEEGEGMMVG